MRNRILLSTLLLVFCMAGCGLEEAKETATPVSTEAPTEAPAEAPTEAPTETPTEAPTEVPPQIPAETPPIKLEEGNQEEAVIEKDSLEDMDWNSVFELPAKDEIAGYMNPNKSLAPYIYGWLDILPEIKYSEYCIDFKADYLPTATYCCLGQWTLDYSALEKEYEEV